MTIFWIMAAFLMAACVSCLWLALPLKSVNGIGHRLAWGIALIIPMIILPIYLMVGSPNIPNAPWKSRHLTDVEHNEAALLRERPLLKQLRQNNQQPDLWLELANLYYRAGRFQNAVNVLREGIEKTPNQSRNMRARLAEILLIMPALETKPDEAKEIIKSLKKNN